MFVKGGGIRFVTTSVAIGRKEKVLRSAGSMVLRDIELQYRPERLLVCLWLGNALLNKLLTVLHHGAELCLKTLQNEDKTCLHRRENCSERNTVNLSKVWGGLSAPDSAPILENQGHFHTNSRESGPDSRESVFGLGGRFSRKLLKVNRKGNGARFQVGETGATGSK